MSDEKDNVTSIQSKVGKPKRADNKPKDKGPLTSANPKPPDGTINIYERLNNFTQDFTGVARDHFNPFHESQYANIDDVWKTIKPFLAKHGIGIAQLPGTAVTEKGLHPVLITQIYCVGENSPPAGTDGWMIGSQFPIPAAKETGQSYGAGMTYVRRYCIVTILNITDYDDDGQSGEVTEFRVASDEAKKELVELVDSSSNKEATVEWIEEKYNVQKDQNYIDTLTAAEVSTLTKTLKGKAG